MSASKTCSECGETKPIDEFYKQKSGKHNRMGKCKKCYDKGSMKYYYKHRKRVNEQKKEYYDKVGREKQGSLPMYENKSCASYLGVVIGERLCKHIFKDVEMMPISNPGYDIVCNKGKKIDVKTASITLNHKKPRWMFHIEHNTIADYFICVAFDNRTDLNPLHIWMIPGNEVNHMIGISISISTIHKWDEWKKDINDAQLCCTEMKNKQ